MTDTRNDDRSDLAIAVEYLMFDMLAQYEDHPRQRETQVAFIDRFGEDAMENMANYFTGWHFAPEEIVMCPVENWERFVEVMNGHHAP